MKDKLEINLGLEGTYFSKSEICKIDGIKGKLYYFGYSIEDLTDKSNFEEVSYLLMNGYLPNRKKLSDFSHQMAEQRDIDNNVINFIKRMVGKSHPMHILSTAMDMVGSYDKKAESDNELNKTKAINIISKISSITAAIGSLSTNGKYTNPDASISHIENFLYMFNGIKPNMEATKLMDTMFILHAEHGSNASTFSSIVTASTLSDINSAIVSGINTLKGPLHGGADERALRMLYGIKEKPVQQYINKILENNGRIMGFGHRIYKTYDPRARIIRTMLKSLLPNANDEVKILADTAFNVEKEMKTRMEDRHIYPNLDFFSGQVYRYLDIPIEMFTPIFAASRSPGWCSHILEYWKNNRLIRPLFYYTGEVDLPYKRIGDR